MEISERTFAMSTYGGLIIGAIQGVGAKDAIYYCILKLSRDVGPSVKLVNLVKLLEIVNPVPMSICRKC